MTVFMVNPFLNRRFSISSLGFLLRVQSRSSLEARTTRTRPRPSTCRSSPTPSLPLSEVNIHNSPVSLKAPVFLHVFVPRVFFLWTKFRLCGRHHRTVKHS